MTLRVAGTRFSGDTQLSSTASRPVQVPVEMPDGVSREGVFGAKDGERQETYYSSVPASTVNRMQSSMQAANAPSGTGYVANGVRITDGGFGGIGVYHADAKASTDEVTRKPAAAPEKSKKLEPKFKISPSLQQVLPLNVGEHALC